MSLSKEVLKEQNNECQICKAKGKYKRATIVHHVKYVRHFKKLALSKYYIDNKSKEQVNLQAVCYSCHNNIHKSKFKDSFCNKERW